MSEIDDIERDLGKQFQAFVTGIATHEVFEFDAPKPPKPPKKKKSFKPPIDKTTAKYPGLKDIPKDKVNKLPPDFDWI